MISGSITLHEQWGRNYCSKMYPEAHLISGSSLFLESFTAEVSLEFEVETLLKHFVKYHLVPLVILRIQLLPRDPDILCVPLNFKECKYVLSKKWSTSILTPVFIFQQ